jgi:hypothetical protein
MKIIRQNAMKIILSLISAFSFIAGAYFSFIGNEGAVLTTIWLTFSIITLVLGYPSTIESIQFFGSSIKFKHITEQVEKITKEIQEASSKVDALQIYWNNIKKKNSENDMSIDIKADASLEELEAALKENVDYSEQSSSRISDRLETIWKEIADYLKTKGIDTSKFLTNDKENPFYLIDWELANIGLPNSYSYIRQLCTQILLKHYEIMLSKNIELSITEQKHFENLKIELESYAENCLAD